MKKRSIIIVIFVLLIIGIAAYLSTFRLTAIEVSGCVVVSEDAVKDSIMQSGYAGNTLKLIIGNKLDKLDPIPFVDKLDIEYLSKNKVSVTVYEKSIAGCISYMDSYVFFDKDGVILESTSKMIKGVPCIKGLSFDSWEKHERLPINDDKKFQFILTITQLIEKYELDIDSIKFTTENEIILTHGDITIELGEGEYLAIQMMNLGSILEGLEGLKGTLYMKDFNSDDATASFSRK